MPDSAETLIVAFATVDGDILPKNHFGEAPQFELYRIGPDTAERLEPVDNRHAGHGQDHGDHDHGDRAKGMGIGRVLKEAGAQVMVARAFGQNITQMRSRFLPVVVGCERVAEAIALLQADWGRVREGWAEGEGRKHLTLRPSKASE